MGSAQGRLDLTAPVAQLLGHDLYAVPNNVIPSPLILPKIDWSTPSELQSDQPRRSRVDITNSAMPGFEIQLPGECRRRPRRPRARSRWPSCRRPCPPSMCPRASPAACCSTTSWGRRLTGPVQLTLPNTAGFAGRGALAVRSTRSPAATTWSAHGRLGRRRDDDLDRSRQPQQPRPRPSKTNSFAGIEARSPRNQPASSSSTAAAAVAAADRHRV